MHARVATFQLGEDPEAMIAQVREDSEGETFPPGLEGAQGLLLLVDRENSSAMAIVFFESEEALRRGDDTLNAMSPAGTGASRTGVAFYEVAAQRMR